MTPFGRGVVNRVYLFPRKPATAVGVPHDGFGGYTFHAFLARYTVSDEEVANIQGDAIAAMLRTLMGGDGADGFGSRGTNR